MRKFVVYPDAMLSEASEIEQKREPVYLHWMILIVTVFVLAVLGFVLFGKIDDVVKVNGLVRPVTNVSSVKNIVSGEIDEIFYKPGDFVYKGQKLLSIRGNGYEAQEKLYQVQLKEVLEKLDGLEKVIWAFRNGSDAAGCRDKTVEARYKAFVDNRLVMAAKYCYQKKLFDDESGMPESATTKSEIENKRFEMELAELSFEQYCSDFISGILQERDQLLIEKEDLLQKISQVHEDLRNLVLVSPVDGNVQETSSLNCGDFIFSDQAVMNIVPVLDEKCRVELQIPAEKIGKLREGLVVKLRFTAFPFAEFGGKNGRMNVIQPDVFSSENGEMFFRAYADVDSLELKDKRGSAYEIKPGCEVVARIVIENQRVLYFLMKKLDMTV